MSKVTVTDDQLQKMIEVHTTFSSWEMGGPAFLANARATATALQELLDRRREDVTTRGLERTFAYDHASSLIDGETMPVQREGQADFDWIDLSSARYEDGSLPDFVEEAITYLDSRGLIERDPEQPDWLSIRDEGEADDILALASTRPTSPS